MSFVCEKGAIRSQITGIKDLPLYKALYEVIDDRCHSKSQKVFIDFAIKLFDNKIAECYIQNLRSNK